ncbi:MAG: hypothetical protein ACOCP8_03870 [archaeon]
MSDKYVKFGNKKVYKKETLLEELEIEELPNDWEEGFVKNTGGGILLRYFYNYDEGLRITYSINPVETGVGLEKIEEKKVMGEKQYQVLEVLDEKTVDIDMIDMDEQERLLKCDKENFKKAIEFMKSY